jgi:hypothetical protein
VRSDAVGRGMLVSLTWSDIGKQPLHLGVCSVVVLGVAGPNRIAHPTAAQHSGQVCSTSRPSEFGCPVISDQSVPLSANFPRSERRSDHGQMILKVLPATQE